MATVRTPASAWVDEGLRVLASHGPDSVRVEPLARALGVSKGGFYWHFADRAALLDAMLAAWERTMVDEVIDAVEAGGRDARTRLRRLFALAASRGQHLKVELAVRDWARRDAAVARRLGRVDDRRMDYLRDLFGSFCSDDEAEARSLLVMSLFVGSHFVAAKHRGRRRAEVVDAALETLLT